MTIAVTVLAIVCVFLTVLVLGLLRSHAEILRALHELGVNLEDHESGPQLFDLREPPKVAPGLAEPTNAPLSIGHDLRGMTPFGDAASVAITMGGHATLLAFLSSGCGICGEFWDQLRSGATLSSSLDARVVAVTRGVQSESAGQVAELAGRGLLTVMSDEAFDDYSVPVAPYFVLVGANGRVIGEGAARSWSQLGGLLERAVADGAAPHADLPSRRDLLAGRTRHDRVDEALASAGVLPGDDSLYVDPTADAS